MTKLQLKKFNFNFEKSFSLLTFHPVTLELNDLNQQLVNLKKAIIIQN